MLNVTGLLLDQTTSRTHIHSRHLCITNQRPSSSSPSYLASRIPLFLPPRHGRSPPPPPPSLRPPPPSPPPPFHETYTPPTALRSGRRSHGGADGARALGRRAAGLPALALLPRRGRSLGGARRGAGGRRPSGGAGPAPRPGRRGGAQEALDGRRRRRRLRPRPRLRRGPPAVGLRRASPPPGGRSRRGLAVGALPRHPPAPDRLHHLLCRSEEELLEIQGTQLLSTTIGVKDYVQSEFDNVEAEIISANKDIFPGTITFGDFLWAFGILRSRVFSGLRGDKLALIPFADLINHNADITSKESCWDIKGKGIFGKDVVFSLQTPVAVKSGEQIYIQYDLDKSNAELALDYGFTESNSSRDAYTLTLEIPESDPFYGDKLDIAELNGLGETAYFDVVLGEPLPPQMLPYLRLLCLGGTDAFLLEALFRNTVWDHLELPVSADNEESICQVIRNACRSALAAYHTTIEEDEELLKREYLQSRQQIAIGVRAGEKKVLQQIDDIFEQREQELDGLEYYQERRLKDLGFVGDNGEIIFWES